MKTINLKFSTSRILRYLLGRYGHLGVITDSQLQIIQMIDYSYVTVYKAFAELVACDVLRKGKDSRFYFHSGIMKGDKDLVLQVRVPCGEYPVHDIGYGELGEWTR